MVNHFTVFKNQPNWAVWLLVAEKHDLGAGLLGIMFDQLGPQRQGCAVFHQGIGGTTSQQLRLQLQTYVHELGHCFNLLHSWQKSLSTPPGVNRPNSLSYMNYPWGYPLGGEAAFWAAFAFQFDDEEVIHLRHAFRNDIVMGGNPFATGAASIAPEEMADPVAEETGLKLDIEPIHRSFSLGEPVVLKLQLTATRSAGIKAHPYLHPNLQMTTVAISRPNGQIVKYEPFIDHLMNGTFQEMGAQGSAITDSAYIGFGKGGFYFDQPGNYKIRAIYQAADGSRVMSNVAEMRVRYPVTAADEEIADLLMGEEQGALFYLLGSDSDHLRKGRDALQTVLDKYGHMPVADYVRLAMGVNAAREFKTVADATLKVTVRPPDTEQAASLLQEAVKADSPVDDLTKVQVLEKLATAQAQVGDREGSSNTVSLIASIEPTSARAARA
jgi:hypothetical protein